MAFHHTQTKSSSPLATDIQQGFIDERAPLNPTTVDPSRTADEGEDEDERDDEMSDTTQKTNKSEKRKEFQTDETAKELQASLPTAASSHASSRRPSDETQEQPERSSKQARTAKKGVEALHDGWYALKQHEESAQEEGW